MVLRYLHRIMLKKLTVTIPFSLLPFFSVLLIAVGMPLLHPILHSHSEIFHVIPGHNDEHISAFADKDHELNCPICDFLATNQLYDTGMEPIIAANCPANKIVFIKNIFLAKTHSLQIEPRAPPVGNSL